MSYNVFTYRQTCNGSLILTLILLLIKIVNLQIKWRRTKEILTYAMFFINDDVPIGYVVILMADHVEKYVHINNI